MRAGRTAYRLALTNQRTAHQKRESHKQHMYCSSALSDHGRFLCCISWPGRIKTNCSVCSLKSNCLGKGINELGYDLRSSSFFDTVTIHTESETQEIFSAAQEQMMNLRMWMQNHISISLDETTTDQEIENIKKLFSKTCRKEQRCFKLRAANR